MGGAGLTIDVAPLVFVFVLGYFALVPGVGFSARHGTARRGTTRRGAAQHTDTAEHIRAVSSPRFKVYRSAIAGRVVSRGERIAAARTRVVIDQ